MYFRMLTSGKSDSDQLYFNGESELNENFRMNDNELVLLKSHHLRTSGTAIDIKGHLMISFFETLIVINHE